MKEPVKKAVKHLREAGATPQRYFCYVLVDNIEDALDRIEFLRELKIRPFAQPLRIENKEPTDQEKRFARWVNRPELFNTVKWEDYEVTFRRRKK